MIADTPTPPYYAVIFTSVRTDSEEDGYGETATRMAELARQHPGCLGFESARADIGITVSYWRDLEAIASFKHLAEHVDAQRRGKSTWYAGYRVRICHVEREYGP